MKNSTFVPLVGIALLFVLLGGVAPVSATRLSPQHDPAPMTKSIASSPCPQNATETFIDRVDSDDLCEVCIEIATLIDDNLKKVNGSIVILEHLVLELCEVLGGKIILQECCVVIDGIQSLVNWLTKGVDPQMACQKIHLCPTNVTGIAPEPIPIIANE